MYDPKAEKGGFTVNTLKGTFRFITGSLPSRSYKIKTPVATIGIRGTILEWRYLDGWLVVSVAEGGVQLCNLVARCVFLKPGTYAITDGRKLSGAKKTGADERTIFGDTSHPLYLRFSGTALPIFGSAVLGPGGASNPPVTDGFSPILTPSGTLPPGLGAQLDATGSLPPGIERNRDPVSRLPPGLQGRSTLPPGIQKKQ